MLDGRTLAGSVSRRVEGERGRGFRTSSSNESEERHGQQARLRPSQCRQVLATFRIIGSEECTWKQRGMPPILLAVGPGEGGGGGGGGGGLVRDVPPAGLRSSVIGGRDEAQPDLVAHMQESTKCKLGIGTLLVLDDVGDVLHQHKRRLEVLYEVVERHHLTIPAWQAMQSWSFEPFVWQAGCSSSNTGLTRE